MAYVPTYEAADAAPVILDLGVTVVVGLVAFASIVGLVFLYRWYKKNRAN